MTNSAKTHDMKPVRRIVTIDDTDGKSAARILDMTGGEGADRGCECVGYQCTCKGHEVPNATMNNLIKAVRPTGGIGDPASDGTTQRLRGKRARGRAEHKKSKPGNDADVFHRASVRLRQRPELIAVHDE